jgi:streptogramin lyase
MTAFPTKKPTAGVNYTVTGFGPTGPVIVQTGPGKGHGGFAAIAPVVEGNTGTVYTHTLGSGNNPHEVVGGPGSRKPKYRCDQNGIDYLSACGLAGA